MNLPLGIAGVLGIANDTAFEHPNFNKSGQTIVVA
jgi:hypothetical protein